MGHTNTKLARLRWRAMKRCQKMKKAFKVDQIDVNALISMEDYENVTQLWLAVRYDDYNLAIMLMEVGADVNRPCGGLCMVPLHLAVYNHNVKLVESLLAYGADPNIMDKWNYTPLMYAAIQIDPFVVNEMFTVLLQNGAQVNLGASLNNEGEIINAQNIDLFDLRSGADGEYITYVRDPMGPTSGSALHHALQNPHLPNETIEILLNHGADVNLPNMYGQTCLMGIIRDVYYDYHSNVKAHAQLLLDKGADPDTKDCRGWSSFHYAAQRGSISCMELLLSANGDCNVSSNVGETPFWIMLVIGWREATEYILQSGCDVDRPASSHTILNINQNADICRYGDIRPLEFALCNRYFHIAKLIVENHCVVDFNTWLGAHVDPPNPRHEEFLEYLQLRLQQRKQVVSLREASRDCVRKTMKQGIVWKTKSLLLPQVIKDYICLRSNMPV